MNQRDVFVNHIKYHKVSYILYGILVELVHNKLIIC